MNTTINTTTNNNWWRGAVIYQIYPRSYQDSNADGIGDLAGITQRLPHIAKLGADAVWISPFFTSPMKDFGYDVADYCDVDSMFGTLADFKALVETAHRLNLKIMIDLVLSHTSDQHPWFAESRQNKTNNKADWYVWEDAKADGTPPTNWLAVFGGPAWQWDSRRKQYYLHNFLVEQPDLNFHNPAVQDAVLDVAKFWLELGVDGFRLDVVNFYFHDKLLRDNPPMPKEDDSTDSDEIDVNPYTHQRHLYSISQPENLDFLQRFRALLDQYDGKAAVGEIGDVEGPKLVAQYTQGDQRLQMCYSFEFLSGDRPTAEHIADIISNDKNINNDGWISWAMSNHDVIRHATRWCSDESGLNLDLYVLFMALQLSLRGSVCLYQGEELGLTEADVAFEDLQDPYGIEFWPEFKGRDGCRTPMVWEAESPNGGFSSVKTWLPVAEEHLYAAADTQVDVQGSVFSAYRQFLQFRKQYQALISGDIDNIQAQDGVLSFERHGEAEKLFCAFNVGDSPQRIDLPNDTTPLTGHGFTATANGSSVELPAGQAYFAVMA